MRVSYIPRKMLWNPRTILVRESTRFNITVVIILQYINILCITNRDQFLLHTEMHL